MLILYATVIFIFLVFSCALCSSMCFNDLPWNKVCVVFHMLKFSFLSPAPLLNFWNPLLATISLWPIKISQFLEKYVKYKIGSLATLSLQYWFHTCKFIEKYVFLYKIYISFAETWFLCSLCVYMGFLPVPLPQVTCPGLGLGIVECL